MEIRADLERILGDVRDRTGVAVSLRPAGGGEKAFTVDYCGERFTLYLSGGASEREMRLIGYLIGNADAGQILDKNGALRSILLGEGTGQTIFRFLTKYNVSDAPCYALDLTVGKRLAEALTHVESCLGEAGDMVIAMDEKRLAVVKFSDDLQTPLEFGQFLLQSLYEELGVKATAGVGCEVRSFSEIAQSYQQAATAVRMSALLRSKGDVHTYREFLLVKMLEEIPQLKLKEYMEQFHVTGAAEVFSDEEMTGTAEEFLENSLNLSETSRNLYMHRNTLMYRLDKIERLTGLNIRKFSDAVTFRVISILYKLLQ